MRHEIPYCIVLYNDVFTFCMLLLEINYYYYYITSTSRVPVEGKSSVCLICMKYRIIFLIIIIISLGQILLSNIAHHARTHGHTCVHTPARTRAHTPPHTPPAPYRYSMGLCQQTVTIVFDNSWSLAIEINTGTGGPVSTRF